MFTRSKFLSIAACLPLITGCAALLSQKADVPTKPHIVDLATRNKEMMSKSTAGLLFGGAMKQLMDVVQNMPTTAIAGHDFSSAQNAFWSDGKPFSGLQVKVQGNAFSSGIVGQPRQATVTTRSEPGKSVISQSSGPFIMTGTYAYTATIPYITCDKLVEVDFDMPACKQGEGDYEVLVGPIDNSVSPVSFRHAVSVAESVYRYAERARQAHMLNAPKSGEETNSEPQTQYEIQRRQAEAEKNAGF